MKSSVGLAYYGISCDKDWVYVDCGTMYIFLFYIVQPTGYLRLVIFTVDEISVKMHKVPPSQAKFLHFLVFYALSVLFYLFVYLFGVVGW